MCRFVKQYKHSSLSYKEIVISLTDCLLCKFRSADYDSRAFVELCSRSLPHQGTTAEPNLLEYPYDSVIRHWVFVLVRLAGSFTLGKHCCFGVRPGALVLQHGRQTWVKSNFQRYKLVFVGIPGYHRNRQQTLSQTNRIGLSMPMWSTLYDAITLASPCIYASRWKCEDNQLSWNGTLYFFTSKNVADA